VRVADLAEPPRRVQARPQRGAGRHGSRGRDQGARPRARFEEERRRGAPRGGPRGARRRELARVREDHMREVAEHRRAHEAEVATLQSRLAAAFARARDGAGRDARAPRGDARGRQGLAGVCARRRGRACQGCGARQRGRRRPRTARVGGGPGARSAPRWLRRSRTCRCVRV